jgi:hypothetical protein
VVVVVDDGGSEAEADDAADADDAVGLESLLHAAAGNRAKATQTNTAHRRERAIRAVLHRR